MKFSQLKMLFSKLVIASAILVLAAAAGTDVSAQSLMPNPAADIDQCANGSNGDLACLNAQWQNGNVNSNQAKYYEGDSIPYRVVMTNLSLGSHSLTIGWDTTKSGKHAIDYLTSWDRTVNIGSDPCSGVAPCGGSPTNFPIPVDPNVTGGGVTPIAGNFSMWGGSITSLSAYTLTGSYAGDSSTRITITFNATQSTVVLAWGGHIATRIDWGVNNSAIAISGSPYHTRVIDLDGSGGNQDRSLAAAAVIYPAVLRITKLVYNASPLSYSNNFVSFGFTTSGLTPSAFSLMDTDPAELAGGSATFNNITTFGSSVNYTVTENNPQPLNYSLLDLSCTISPGGLGAVGTITTDFNTRTVTYNPLEGNIAECIFKNTRLTPTAAPAEISGSVMTSEGVAIRGALLTLTNLSTGETFYTRSNTFGRYTFQDVMTDDVYNLSVTSKGYTFFNSTQTFTLRESVSDVNFIANGENAATPLFRSSIPKSDN
ncbi:MAG: carboxypeptidase-like regulatory domain-containing protein [Pyrinomonadaceae bacterium]